MGAKSDRGYQLVDGADALPRAVHAEPVSLDPTISVGDALQAIGRGCLRQLLRNEAAALAAKPEGIHQMRIAVRRLRSALSSFKKMLPAEDLAWITGELKWLMSALAEARNLDAFGTDLLEPTRDAVHDEPGFDDLAAAVDRLRRAAYERVRDGILSERYPALMLHLLHWFEARSWRGRSPFAGSDSASQPIGEVTPLLLDRRRRKMRQRSKHFGRLNSRKRHKLRIAGKKLRYAIELLESLFNQQDLQKFTKRLKRLQDDLGHANDVSVAHDFLRRLCTNAQFDSPVANAGARLLEWHERAMVKGERKLRKRLRRLNHAKPFWRARPPR